jgi:hypothetical protein
MNAALYTSLLVLLGLVAVASSQITQSPAQPLGTPISHGKPPVPSRGAACQDDIPTGTYPYCDNCTGTTTTTAGYNVQTPVSCRCSSSCVQAASLGLFSEEKTWLATRTAAATQAMSTYFTSAWGKDNIQYNLSELLEVVPRIGLAFSGGGYRAMLGGAGVMQAFDDTKNGGVAGVAGILSSSLYISGLSGGGWLVGLWALNSFAPVQDLVSAALCHAAYPECQIEQPADENYV